MEVLNDDCLLHIFGYCDLQTLSNLCKLSERFSTILRRYNVSKDEKFIIRRYISFSLASFHDTMRHIGPCIVNAEINLADQTRALQERIVSIFVNHVGDYFKRLELNGSISKHLKPLFLRLKELQWNFDVNDKGLYLPHLCPRLGKFEVKYVRLTHDIFNYIGTGTWPTLKAVNFEEMDNYNSSPAQFYTIFETKKIDIERMLHTREYIYNFGRARPFHPTDSSGL